MADGGIDAMSIGTVLTGVGTLAGAFAIFAAAWMGTNTFEAWRRQKLSERRIEQAERILTATYKVRRGLSFVRNPMLWGHELQAAEDYLKEKGQLSGSKREDDRLTTAQLYFTRMNGELDNRRALDECLPMARALFGEQVEKAMDELNRHFNYVNAAVQAQYRFDEHTEREFRDDIEGQLWSGYPTTAKNKMDQDIAALVVTIEGACVPVLRLET